MSRKDCRNFSRLYPHTANLDLIIESSVDRQRAVEAVTTAVSGPVDDVVPVDPKWVRNESILLLADRIDIAEAAKRRTKDDFPHLSDPAKLRSLPQYQGLRIRE